MAQKLISLN